MSFTRRAELTCTLEELRQNGTVVLLKNELLRVKQEDGSYATIRGDGVTPLNQLSYETDYAVVKANEAADRAERTVEYIRGIGGNIANALKRTLSGSGIVTMKDVSPIYHELKVTAPNASGQFKVKRYGKNLFRNDTSVLKAITHRTSDGRDVERFGYALALPAGVYTASLIDLDSSYGNRYIYGTINDKNGAFKQEGLHLLIGNIIAKRTFTIEDGDIYYIYDGVYSAIESSIERFNTVQIQVELGSSVTEYEKYVEPIEYSSDENGIMPGIPALYPSTTLISDDGLMLVVSYNRDMNKIPGLSKDVVGETLHLSGATVVKETIKI